MVSNRRAFFAFSLGCLLLGISLGFASAENAQDSKSPVEARLKIAQKVYSVFEEDAKNPRSEDELRKNALDHAERIALWSRRWMKAQSELNNDDAGRVAALEGHLRRLAEWEKRYVELGKGGFITQMAVEVSTFHRLEAESMLAKMKSGKQETSR